MIMSNYILLSLLTISIFITCLFNLAYAQTITSYNQAKKTIASNDSSNDYKYVLASLNSKTKIFPVLDQERNSTDAIRAGNIINISNNVGFSYAGLSSIPTLSSRNVVTFGSNVYIVWQDNTPGNYDIFFKSSTDNGTTFGKTVNLSNNTGFSGYPRLAAYGSNVYIVWRDETPGNYDIFFKSSTDNGTTFGKTVNLSNNTGFSGYPSISTFRNNVYIVWQDNTPGNNYDYDIFFKSSTDNGTTFGKTVDITNNTGSAINLSNINAIFSSTTGIQPQISTFSNNVYIVWQGKSAQNYDIFFKASTDNGTTFGTAINLSNNTGFSGYPRLAVYGNNVYIVWQDNTPGNYDIFFKSSTDNGTTFGKTVTLSNNIGQPSTTVGGKIQQLFGPTTVTSTQQNNTGATTYNSNRNNNTGQPSTIVGGKIQQLFGPTTVTSTQQNNTGATTYNSNRNNNTGQPSTTVGGKIQQLFGPTTVTSTQQNNTGTTTYNSNRNNNTGFSDNPSISVFRNNVYIVWQDGIAGNNFDIFFKASTDNGTTFGTAINLSNNTGFSGYPRLAAYGNNVYIVWQDNTPGNSDILFKASTDNGTTFSTAINLSNNTNTSSLPQISIYAEPDRTGSSSKLLNIIYVVWNDLTPGNWEIFFKAVEDNFSPKCDPIRQECQ